MQLVTFLLVFIAIGISTQLSTDRISHEWTQFKVAYNKQYRNVNEENHRRATFLKNLKSIDEHNKKFEEGLVKYKVGINKFADLTQAELAAFTNTASTSSAISPLATVFQAPEDLEVPDSLDWRDLAVVERAGDQGVCGSCWTFAVCGTIETHLDIYLGLNVSLSEQNLLDCVVKNDGCEAKNWHVSNAYEYVIENGGLDTEEGYPYKFKEGRNGCDYKPERKGVVLKGYGVVENRDEEMMRKALATVGPLTANLNTVWGFFSYKGGIYYDDAIVCDVEINSHALSVVGYGTEDGVDYWIMKNSWGTWWGENGYIRIQRNENVCGIANDITYPIIDPALYPHNKF